MTKFLAGVLSVIAVGVLLIAYGLLGPRATSFDPRDDLDRFARPTYASEQMMLRDNPSMASFGSAYQSGAPMYAVQGPAYGYAPAAVPQLVSSVQPVRAASTAPAAPRRSSASVERSRGRDWTKTAMVIGGSSAAA